MHLTAPAYTLLGLTALVAGAGRACWRSRCCASRRRRPTRSGSSRGGGAETALLSAALQEAVTKLKAQERATAARADASERLSGEIISSLTAGLLVVGLNGEIRILNPAGLRMLDRPESLRPDAFRALAARAAADGRDRRVPARPQLDRPAGSGPAGRRAAASRISASPCRRCSIRTGELHGAICLFTDLTAVKDLEEQLRLKESLATVGELTAGIAHEFRNGLATIQGYSKLIDLNALPAPYRPYVEGIRAETESLRQVVTNFLNFARPAQLTLTEVDLGAICERAAEEIRPDARALGGDVEVRGEFGVVEGDEVLLRQAFSNLLRNALEACAGAAAPPRIAIQSEVDRAAQGVADHRQRQRPGHRRRRCASASSSRSSRRSATAPASASRWCRRSSSFTTAASSWRPLPQGGASFQITLPLRPEPRQLLKSITMFSTTIWQFDLSRRIARESVLANHASTNALR